MKKLIIGSVTLFLTVMALAQPKLPGQCEVWLPKVIDKEVIKKSDAETVLRKPYGQNLVSGEKHYWIVFSDRDNNPAYNAPKKGALQCSTLSFNERLIIASIKDGYALVYSEPKMEKYPYISSAATSRGWVPLTNLLLWTKALSDEADISYKAVICANLNETANEAEGKLYKHPHGKAVGLLQTDMHFYFIMKEEAGKALLGHYASIETDSDRGLYGWVDNGSFVPWNHRTCLEPTWDISAVEWFSTNKKKWQVFSEKEKMTGKAPAEDGFDSKKVRMANDQYATEYKYRSMPARRLRYPILDGCTDKLYHCSSFGTLNEKAEVPDIDADVRVAIENIKNTEVINIGIVIDGTSSMKPYFASVKNAIVEGCKYFGSDSRVNVAVAIYRDKEDGEYVCETFPSAGGFTDNPNNPNLKRFLDNGGKYGVRSVAQGETESVYYGIRTAIDKFNFNPKQSNLMLVVGDCGDNGKMGVRREEIIDLLASKKISLMAFQVRNKSRESFQTFNTQMTYIMKQSLQKRYAAQAALRGNVSKAAVVSAIPLENGTGWDIYNVNNTGSEKYADLYRFVHRRNPKFDVDMNVAELTGIMETTINDWNGRIRYLRSKAQEVIDGNGFVANNDGDGNLTDALIELLGGDKARFERLAKLNSLISFRGWTYKKEPYSGRDLFKIVVFMPANELKVLVEKLEPVYRAARNRRDDAESRASYHRAVICLAGTLVAQERIQAMKYKEIIAKVSGLDSGTGDIGGPSLADIVDPNAVPTREYLDIIGKMKSSYERLHRIMSEYYPFIIEMAGSKDKYYWLPSEYLPL